MVSPEQIKEWWNIFIKLTSSERWTFLAIMICALLSIVWIVIFYVRSMDWLIDKYNSTINIQQEKFLDALKDFK